MRASLTRAPAGEVADSSPVGRRRAPPLVWTAVLALALIGAWEVSARAGWISALFFPPPSVIAVTLTRLFGDGRLGAHIAASLARVAEGSLLGCAPAAVLGLTMGWWPRVRAVLDPLIAAVHPMPKIALLPLLMVLVGIGEWSKVLAVALSAFFPMLLAAMAGVREIDPLLFDVVESYGADRRRIFASVVLPGSLPLLLTGLRLAVNVTLVTTIAVELVAADRGLGKLIWFAWETMRPEELYAGLVVIATVGVLFNTGLALAARRLAPWRTERSR